MKHNHQLPLRAILIFFGSMVAVIFGLLLPFVTHAATLSLSPATGVYTTGGTFTASVMVNTEGKPVNAADATLKFNPNEFSIVSVNRSGSIFNLWVTEPTFSNSAGTISFSGGLPSGYTGSNGRVMSVTFRAKTSGTNRVSFSSGSVLANDGRGTNVLTNMGGGSYTIQAMSAEPEPEVIVEYVPPANTPAAPVITSNTHADPTAWHNTNEAVLSWSVPSDVTALRTLLDERSGTIPTKVYDTPINNITLSDLPEGVSYFHLQFKNADGWGKVTHHRLAVDTIDPESINIRLAEDANLASPEQRIIVDVVDQTSDVKAFKVKVDSDEPFDFVDENGSSTIPLPPLAPGYHTIIVEAFDEAGNSVVGTFSLTIESFDRPVFTEYPSEINEEVIPVIKGTTRPNATVEISLTKLGSDPAAYTIESDESGEFTFIPEGTFSLGVYELWAKATDEFGAESEPSERIRIAVQQPGYVQIGSMLISVLSIIVPLLALIILLILGFWYLVLSIKRLRKRVRVESVEALEILRREFSHLRTSVEVARQELQDSRKTKKLTKAEGEMLAMFETSLDNSEERVRQEIEDVSDLVDSSNDRSSDQH